MNERFKLFIMSFGDTRGYTRRHIWNAVFLCNRYYVRSYVLRIEDLTKQNKRVA